MAGGIDWFRWHHGSVTDPKFQLVAKKAQARLGDVIAVWAFILEAASAGEERGHFGTIDGESLDFMLGMEDGTTDKILAAMEQRDLIGGGYITAWEKRQPKKEDDTAAERKRRQREREHELKMASVTGNASRDVTQSHDESRSVTIEERRGEESITSPKGEEAKADFCPQQAIVDLYHEALPTARRIRDWTPARQQALRARWRERPDRQSVEWWRNFFGYVAKSDFLCGRTSSQNRKPFELSLDWLCKSENFVKVLEGAYEN